MIPITIWKIIITALNTASKYKIQLKAEGLKPKAKTE